MSAARIALSEPLTRAIEAAIADARLRRHRVVTAEHLLAALLPEGAAALVADCGVDAEGVARDLAEYLELQDTLPARSRKEPKRDVAFERPPNAAIVQVAHAGRHVVEVGDVLVALLREAQTYATRLLEAEGLTRLALLRRIAHGTPELRVDGDGDRPGDGEPAALRFHNDDYTTMEFVVAALTELCGLPQNEATALMLEVHHRGGAVVGRWPGAEARRRAARVMEVAAHAGFPLRCTVERAKL